MKMDAEKLLKEYDLKIGDQLILVEDVDVRNFLPIYTITRLSQGTICLTEDTDRYDIGMLFNREWEPYDPKSYVGMKSCSDFTKCEGCPLYGLNCQDLKGKNLNAKWEAYKKAYPQIVSSLCDIDCKLQQYYIKK